MPSARPHPEVVVNTPEPRIHIVGVGPDGLSGLTTRARELLTQAEVVFGSEQVLALVPELRARAARPRRRPARGRQRPHRRPRPQARGDPGGRRSALLRRRPLPVRAARHGPLRGAAARQLHANGLRPGQGNLGRRLLDRPANAPAGDGAGPHPHGRDGRPVPERGGGAGRGGAAAPGPRAGLLPGLRLREPRRPRRARHAGRIERHPGHGIRAADGDDPAAQAGPAPTCPRGGGRRRPALRQPRRRLRAEPAARAA